MNTSVFNYFMVLRDAIHLDLGNIDLEQNVFLNSDAFRTRVLSDPFMSRVTSRVIGPRGLLGKRILDNLHLGGGCLNGTWTDALRNNDPAVINITSELPLRGFDNPYPTIVDANYVCPVFRTKQPGSFLASIFVGTFSMYTAMVGAFMFIAPLFDERYRKKHSLGQNPLVNERSDARQCCHLTHPYQTLPDSSAPYATAFEAPNSRYTSMNPIPRYNPVSDCVFVRTPRKGEELPPGAYTPGAPGVHTPNQAVGFLPPMTEIGKPTLTRTTSYDSGNSGDITCGSRAQDHTPLAGSSIVYPIRPPGLSRPHSPSAENEQSALLGGYSTPRLSSVSDLSIHSREPSFGPQICIKLDTNNRQEADKGTFGGECSEGGK
ncbi:hypothetical protein B0J17DRAFT_672593 [Rhizoctonia solani]|nr:hypothetical protein B0J17DRAFT_672593 [Rhizoctonia solani]